MRWDCYMEARKHEQQQCWSDQWNLFCSYFNIGLSPLFQCGVLVPPAVAVNQRDACCREKPCAVCPVHPEPAEGIREVLWCRVECRWRDGLPGSLQHPCLFQRAVPGVQYARCTVHGVLPSGVPQRWPGAAPELCLHRRAEVERPQPGAGAACCDQPLCTWSARPLPAVQGNLRGFCMFKA